MKTADYAAIHGLNQNLDQVIDGVELLRKSGLIPGECAEARRVALEEIRARINFAVARSLESREAQDLCKFEDLRIAAVRRETGGDGVV
jgi:hypothetical protein